MRGKTNFGCLVWIVILVAGLYVGYKFGEAQWNYFSVREKVFEISRFAATSPHFEQGAIINQVIKAAEEFGINLTPDDVKITEGENTVKLEVSWVTDLEFPFYTYSREYSITASQKKGL